MARSVHARTSADVSVPVGQSITIYTRDVALIQERISGGTTPLGTVTSGQQTFGPFASGAVVVINASAATAYYGIGSEPIIREFVGNIIQRAPAAISAAGSIPLSAIFGGLINANAGLLGITGTLPTGTAVDAAGDFNMDDSFDWHVISTGLGTFTVGASVGHTVVGSGAVGSGMSGIFRTRKTATDTFVSYRIG